MTRRAGRGGGPLRVAAILDSLGVGGVETGCLDLLRGLDRARFTPAAWSFRPGALEARVREAGIPLWIGHDRPAEDPTWTDADTAARARWTARLAAELAEARIDVCITYGWPEAIEASRLAGVGAVVERIDGAQIAGRVADKSALAAVICESRNVRDVLRVQRVQLGIDPRRLVVIPNGVDLDRFRPRPRDRAAVRASLGLPADAFVVGSVARLAAQKNLGLLVDAFDAFVARDRVGRADAWLVLAGPDDGERAALERQVDGLGLRSRVLLPGPVADPERVLQAFDVFALVSWIEGSPFAVLEAMAAGLPLIATPVGGVHELLADNALIVDPIAPVATTRALGRLHGDPALRTALGRRSRALARRRSLRHMVERYERLLEAVATRPPT